MKTEPVKLTPEQEAAWLRDLFAYEWCAECGRDHRHHTVVYPVFGLPFARCDLPPVIQDGELVTNPERYT